MATKNVIRVKATNPGIACDFCDKPLSTHPEIGKAGWSYVWKQQDFGSAAFQYAACSECCDKEHGYLEKVEACIKRAGRHSKAWRTAVDRFITDKIWTAEAKNDEAVAEAAEVE